MSHDTTDLDAADIYRVSLRFSGRVKVFSSLAHAIEHLIEHQIFHYSLDVIRGDFIEPLVTEAQAEEAVYTPEDGTGPKGAH